MPDPTTEAELVALAKAGDRVAADALVKSVAPWCYRCATRAAARVRKLGLDPEELAQVGLVAAWKSIDSYNPARHPRWRTYCFLVAERQVWTAVRDARRRVARERQLEADDEPRPAPARSARADALAAALATLDPLARELVLAPDKGGIRLAARRLGVGLWQARRVRAAARAAIRAIVGGGEVLGRDSGTAADDSQLPEPAA